MKILILIPARGGSKGIPQKNIRFLNGKPLIYYAIRNAKAIKGAEVYLSTDDVRIKEIASVYGVEAIGRPEEASTDEATIDDVTVYSLDFLEKELDKKYDVVITLQPTSPLLKSQSLQKTVDYFMRAGIDTLISANEKHRLMWTREEEGFEPLYKKRVNRQELEPFFEESGAFVICRSGVIRTQKTRIGETVEIFALDEEEGIDIDTLNDWGLAEDILGRKNIALVANGSYRTGMGHIYRSLTLADKLMAHNVTFFSQTTERLGIDKLKSLNYGVVEFDTFDELVNLLKERKIDIVINDILNTDYRYIKRLKDNDFFVVNFEDSGDGGSHCDLLFNALYEWSGEIERAYYGYKYECLREDIYLYPVKTGVSKKVKNIIVAFGGTDINNATLQVLRFMDGLRLDDIKITLILGIGYRWEKELEEFLKVSRVRKNIEVVKDVLLMSRYINDADLVITGNGRMVYEVVALATPLIVFSQNERESHHIFAKICPGVNYAGTIQGADKNEVSDKLQNIIDDYEYREKMNHYLIPFAKDVRKGINRVVDIIFETYHDKEKDEDLRTL
jgi:CMP-N-acetylneuraminic acid synthetase